ncbi:MAG: NAD-dependent epimerase/dehydratase family protein [Candidatus Krumholzibacteria bacterium]|nr:NAD-dependent epimerase/dehydratase family protein [Candidatus Krumholzibacteria bacterium]
MKGKVVVTGAAGFIGSHLCERLLDEGYSVTGIDCFTDYYSPERKRGHLSNVLKRDGFALVEEDLTTCSLEDLFEGAECVFHLAAQAGVRHSWGLEFSHYIESNILATQKVLEALKKLDSIRLIYSSSSSVYGETNDLPMREDHRLKPISPYGATKLSAEHLCELYRLNFGISYTALRYFTVYGPRQRPDMAFSRFITSALCQRPLDIYGDGKQTRDFTYVSDAVEANIEAIRYDGPVRIFNIGGGGRVTLLEVLGIIEREIGSRLEVRFSDRAKGDVTDTWADTSSARSELGFNPSVPLGDGVRREIDWYRAYLDANEGRTSSGGD